MKRLSPLFLSVISISLLNTPSKAQTDLNGHEYVDLGLSVKWATCNIGAEKPYESGTYYAWGETETKTVYGDGNYALLDCIIMLDGDDDSWTDVYYDRYDQKDGKVNLEPDDDVAHVKWGGSWRMPTKDECQELIDNCTCTWDTINGVYGFLVTSNKAGYEGQSIFLPATGYYVYRFYSDDNPIFRKGEVVQLYTSTKDSEDDEQAYVIAGSRDNEYDIITPYIGLVGRHTAQYIRPICP